MSTMDKQKAHLLGAEIAVLDDNDFDLFTSENPSMIAV